MGCWGITSFESDAGLDAVCFIRNSLPASGKLELGEIIEALQQDAWHQPPSVEDADSHTSPMAVAEIMVKFLDGDAGSLDYSEKWAEKENKFNDITSFSASKEALQWLRDYLADTLKNAKIKDQQGRKWCGWFQEKDWISWQKHMDTLISRLNPLLASPESSIELISWHEQNSSLSAKDFNILEQVCASTPDGHHFLIIQVHSNQIGDTVWAIGDDQVCAITRADFIRNKDIEYNNVLIQEFPYEENTPESVGSWRSLIEELVRFTMEKHLQHDGLIHVYPQWLPEDVKLPIERSQFLEGADHVILYDNNTIEVVPKQSSHSMESQSF